MSKLDLLQRVKALAERGVGGEAENAAEILEKLMKKYGISEEQLDEEHRSRHDFTFHGKEEKKLLMQIVYKVTGEMGRTYGLRYTVSGRPCRTTIGADCTSAEKVEIEYLFDFYKRLWEREREAFLAAFIQKHKLFGSLPDGVEPERLDDEELEKMFALMRGMSNESPLRAIGDGK